MRFRVQLVGTCRQRKAVSPAGLRPHCFTFFLLWVCSLGACASMLDLIILQGLIAVSMLMCAAGRVSQAGQERYLMSCGVTAREQAQSAECPPRWGQPIFMHRITPALFEHCELPCHSYRIVHCPV